MSGGVEDRSVSGALDGRLVGLSPEKRALLERRLRARRATTEPAPIPRRAASGVAPMSFTQELMWLLHELTPGLVTYNSFGTWRLTGPLDVEALQAAVDGVVARHDTLRTTFEARDGEPVQVVHDDVRVVIDVLDHPDLADDALEELLVGLIRTPFDLSAAPLLRYTLVRLGADDHALLMVTNHILWDGWSNGIMWRELAELYTARLEGRAPALHELPIQYTDFAAWQREFLNGEQIEHELAYWLERLAGVPPLLELPIDHPRPPVKTHDGDRLSLWIDAGRLQALEALARRAGVTMFMLVTASWAAFLHRLSGQDDLVLGTPIASRNRVEVEGLIGYFANTLALRIDCAGDPTFLELLGRVRETVVGAFSHQDVPFERVLRSVATQRDPSYSPVFQSLVVFQNASPKSQRLGDVEVEMFFVGPRTAKFDLTMGMGVRGGRLHASFEYNTDLFEPATVARYSAMYEQMIDGLLDDPSLTLSALPLLAAAEQAALLEAGRGVRVPVPEQSLYDAFVHQVASTPDAEAVRWRGQALSYAELAGRAAAVAAGLRARGAGPGTRVGFCLERTPDQVATVLGVLGSGAAAVPLDPGYPDERLRMMLEDAEILLVVSEPGSAERFAGLDVEVEAVADLEAAPGDAAAHGPGPKDAAYVIFTSGSTGRPKGVELGHRGLLNHALASIDRYGISPEDTVLQFASISFDISLEEIFCALLSGAALVLRDDAVPLGGPGFALWLERQAVTVMDLPTAFWHEWTRDLDANQLDVPPALRLLIVGGERVAPESFDRWRELAPAVRFVNSYGPTEASVVATAFEPPPGWQRPAGADVPIGTPLANVDVHVLDARGGVVADGVRGELYISGAGVALGYLGRPDATAERFVMLPATGQRAYRTGDLVRRLPGGELEYAGRADGQVKLRGFRIEPGEVETALMEAGGAAQAFVLVRDEAAGEPALVAYVVPEHGAPEGLEASLRAALAERLPAYAVPSAVVAVDAIPLTPNGKVDRAALPAPGPAPVAERAEPADEVEQELARIWSALLGHEVGVLDQFFEIGGHSMLAVRMFTEAERRLGVRLPLATLLRAPTVRELARVIRDGGVPAHPWKALVPMRPDGDQRPLFLVHSLPGDVLIYRNLVRAFAPGLPIYGFEALGFDRRHAPHARIPDMAALYVEELRTVQPEGPYRLAGHCFGGAVAHEMAHQLERRGEDVEFVGLMDARPFGLVPHKSIAVRTIAHIHEASRMNSAEVVPFLRSTADNVHERIERALLNRIRRHVFVERGRPVPKRLLNMSALVRSAAAGYHTPLISARVTLLRVDEPHKLKKIALQQRWGEFSRGGVDVRELRSPGITHNTMFAAKHVPELARTIEAALGHETEAAPKPT